MFKFILIWPLLTSSLNSLAHGIDEESKKAMIEGGVLKYICLGAEHMLTGYDHLLFLLGVIFFLTTFKDIVKFISVFTLGHSVTLILGTFMGLQVNYWLIDAVIALSVCYKGFDNNEGFQKYLGMKKAPHLLAMVFIFGLIHGLGLSTRLQQLPLGEKGMEMLMRILSFNVGVELGQIAALTVMLIILSRVRNTLVFKKFSKVVNDGLVMAGFLLFLMQIHGYLHTANPQEFAPTGGEQVDHPVHHGDHHDHHDHHNHDHHGHDGHHNH